MYYDSEADRLFRFDDENEDFVKTNEALMTLADIDEDIIPEDHSMSDFYESRGFTSAMKTMANAGFANTLCANSDELSLKQMIRWGKFWGGDGALFRLNCSYEKMIAYLSKGVHVKVTHNTDESFCRHYFIVAYI